MIIIGMKCDREERKEGRKEERKEGRGSLDPSLPPKPSEHPHNTYPVCIIPEHLAWYRASCLLKTSSSSAPAPVPAPAPSIEWG